MTIFTQILTAALTVFGGVFVFVVGQMFLKLLEPAWELKREIARIAHSLDFFANQMSGDTPKGTEAREGYRNHACSVREKLALVVGYGFWEKVVLLPTKREGMVASR